jgi:hypothetical protein
MVRYTKSVFTYCHTYGKTAMPSFTCCLVQPHALNDSSWFMRNLYSSVNHPAYLRSGTMWVTTMSIQSIYECAAFISESPCTPQVWDYVGDNYVHRLIQSKTDGKLVEVPSPSRPQVRRESAVHIHTAYTHSFTRVLDLSCLHITAGTCILCTRFTQACMHTQKHND